MYKKLPEDFSLLCDLRSSKPAQLTSETLRLLKFSVSAEKYSIYSNINGIPRGYIAWADVNNETLLRINRIGSFPRYLYEWDEGDIRLIIDVLMHSMQGEPKLFSLISELVKDSDHVAFVKRGKLKVYVKKNGRFMARPILEPRSAKATSTKTAIMESS